MIEWICGWWRGSSSWSFGSVIPATNFKTCRKVMMSVMERKKGVSSVQVTRTLRCLCTIWIEVSDKTLCGLQREICLGRYTFKTCKILLVTKETLVEKITHGVIAVQKSSGTEHLK